MALTCIYENELYNNGLKIQHYENIMSDLRNGLTNFGGKRKLVHVKAPAKLVMFYLENDHMVVL